MPSTIELLETIGRDAALRHAPNEDLVKALANLNASEYLKHAAVSGTHAPLTLELGHRIMTTTHHVNQTCPDEEEEVAPNREGSDGIDSEQDVEGQ